MACNLYAKRRTKDDPYEIWESADGRWKYLVLKKYKATVTSEFDRWYCCTISPMTPQGEYGDAYVATVTNGTTKTFDCFVSSVQQDEQTTAPKCDVCLTWVATHDVSIGKDVYHVCDKPRCQDKVAALIPLETEGGHMDSPEWHRQFDVLHVSRLGLLNQGFTVEQISQLTDEDMQEIADSLHEDYNSLAGGFGEAVAFVTSLQLTQKGGDA